MPWGLQIYTLKLQFQIKFGFKSIPFFLFVFYAYQYIWHLI